MLTTDQLATCTDRFQMNYKELFGSVLIGNAPLKLSLVGTFSVGKSSLLNALIDDKLLPVAMEEKTAKPTLLFYNAEPSYQFVGKDDGGPQDVSREEMQGISGGALDWGDGILTVGYPAEFLRGIQVFDLPGTGGNDPERRRVMQTQLEVSDVIFYLIFPKGPSAEDLRLIQSILSNGKTVYVIINQYDDDVDLALETYREDLEDVGYTNPIYLASAVKKRGLEPLKTLLQNIVSQQDAILEKRFSILFQQLLDQELRLLEEEQQILRLSLSDDSASVQRQLNEQRSQITAFKAELRQAKQERWKVLSHEFSEAKQQELLAFKKRIESMDSTFLQNNYSDQNWVLWLDGLKLAIDESTSRIIQQLPDTSGWFDEAITSKMDALDIPPPYIPTLKEETFREAAKVQELSMEIATLEQDTSDFPEHNVEMMQSVLKEQQEQYQMVLTQHTSVMNTEVPMIEQRDGIGSTIGSAIGNVADIALLVVNPATAGTKVAGWLGKGGKLSSTIINAGKAAKIIKQTDSIKKASTAIGKAVELSLAMRKQRALNTLGVPIIQDPTLDKKIQKSGVGHMVGALEKLSLGYWGKKIGGVFDRKYLVEDPAIAAKKVEQLNLLNGELSSIQTAVETLQRGIFEAEGDAIQKRRLQMKLEQKQALLAQKNKEMQQWQIQKERDAEKRKTQIIQDAIEQSLNRSHHRLEARLLGLETELHKCFTAAYKELDKASVQERTAQYETLELSLRSPLEDKQHRLSHIDSQIVLLKHFVTH